MGAVGSDTNDAFGFHLPKHLAVASKGRLLECETTDLLVKLGSEMGRQRDEMAPHIHRLVTLNWLEDIDDLLLVEDRHWTDWDLPERLVLQIKAELAGRREDGIVSAMSNFGASTRDFLLRMFGFI